MIPTRSGLPSRLADPLRALAAAAAAGVCILLLAVSQSQMRLTLLIPPFGASCVLVFLVPDSPLAQPRNVIGGHLVSSLMGLLSFALFGSTPVGYSVGVAAAIFVMALTRTVHPPAGADPLVIVITRAHWAFLLYPLLVGTLVIVAFGCLFHRFGSRKAYPRRK